MGAFNEIQLTPIVDSASPSTVGFHGFASTASDHILPQIITIETAKKVFPWKVVADWTHSLPSSPTERWMDAVGKDQYFHRWKGHHVIKDGLTVMKDPNMSLADFGAGLSKDVITIHGIPLIPDSAVSFLSKTLGTSVHDTMPWVLKNAFDLTIGVLAIGDAGHDLFLAFTGQMEWGFRTVIFTFGTGTAEVAAGLATRNPLLIMAGMGEYASGIKCAWDYYHQPFLFDVPVSDLLGGLGIGATAGFACSVVTMALTWSNTTPREKMMMAMKSTGSCGVLGFLAAISPWISVPAGIVWSVSNLAATLARDGNRNALAYRLSSPWALSASFRNVLATSGPHEAFQLLRLAEEISDLKPYREFMRRHADGITLPKLNEDASSFLNRIRQ